MPFWEVALRFLGAIAALVVVLVLAWLALRAMNRRLPGLGGAGSGKLIQVLDRTPAGKNGSIMLLRVKSKVLLVAVTENTAATLAEFDDPDGTIDVPPPAAGGPSFQTSLKDAMGKLRFGGKPDDTSGGDEP